MLGLLFDANYMQNEHGDANVACPAPNGCKCMVRKRPLKDSPYKSHPNIEENMDFVVYAEVASHGDCPAGHTSGDTFIFPTCMKADHMCPASWYQTFPLLVSGGKVQLPSCLELGQSCCPDWHRPDMLNTI